ncbi:hypothetical protein G7Y89_g4881 [Cudoniella acicularis]|uniref:Cytochrome P450 n=1 Tax=Cudoniella acicularis TaxID=354080 RepID=A0A8H4W706_9HELO|nr:hypothetical protein G7Y89_g4881 [Cudoniella acicularis]
MALPISKETLFSLISEHLALIAGIFVLAFFANNYFYKGLHKVPGPFLGALTNWYRIYYVIVGRRQDANQNRMHEKYGDVVRYGPNLVSFSNPNALKDIYGIGTPLTKSPYYLPFQAMSKGRAFAALFTLLENKPHSDLRRTVASCFSGTSIVSLEPLVNPVIERWIEQTKRIYVKENKICNVTWWMQLFAFDVVTNLMYSTTHGMVEKHEDVDGIVSWLDWMFDYISVVCQMPILDQFINKNPIQRFLELSGLRTPTFATVAFAKKRIAERISKDPSLIPTQDGMRSDILTQMMENGKKHPQILTEKMITSQSVSIAFAGSDNTAVTITAIIYFLLKNPRAYQKLMVELDDAAANGPKNSPISTLALKKHSVSTLPWAVFSNA